MRWTVVWNGLGIVLGAPQYNRSTTVVGVAIFHRTWIPEVFR